jgi:lysophospholipase L1-like esterase
MKQNIISVINSKAFCFLLVFLSIGIFVYSYTSGSMPLFITSCIACAAAIFNCARKMARHYVAAAVLLSSLALFFLFLPLVDTVLRPSALRMESSKPVYSFAAFKEDGGSFRAWWQLYSDTWIKTHWTIFEKDTTGRLKYVPKLNTCANFMDGKVCVNNLGLIGTNINPEKRDNFRIIALGESTTMGVPLDAEYVPWPQILEKIIGEKLTCKRPIQVLNAGIAGYNISDNNIRFKTYLLSLQPDLVLSYHGYNGFHFIFDNMPEPQAALPEGISHRPSELLKRLEYSWRLRNWIRSNVTTTAAADAELSNLVLYSHFAELARAASENNVDLAFLTYNMAIDEKTPQDVVDFYGSAFLRAEKNIVYNNIQNRILKDISHKRSARNELMFIDTSDGLMGAYDKDYYTDLVHFTKTGDRVMAQNVFNGLRNYLENHKKLQCQQRH